MAGRALPVRLGVARTGIGGCGFGVGRGLRGEDGLGAAIAGRHASLFVGRIREVATAVEAVRGVIGERPGEHPVETRQFRALVTEPGRVVDWRRAGQQVKSGGGQGVLVGAPVDLGAGQLLGRRVTDGAGARGYPEVGQQDSLLARGGTGQQDVGGFDVAMQQPAVVGVVESRRDRGDDREHLVGR